MNKKISNFIDMHVHSAPDIRKRSHNDLELARQAVEASCKAIVIKSHQFPTVDRAWYLKKLYPTVDFFGSVTCNYAIGGLNEVAVQNAIDLGAKVIWLPTIDAANHRFYEKKSGGISILDKGELTPEIIEILEIAVKNNVVIGTGHISVEEIEAVAIYLANRNFRKLVVTHPEFHLINMSLENQKRMAAEYGVIFERTYAQPLGNGRYKLNLEDNLKAVQEVGYQSTIISSDSGQVENPSWNLSLPEYYDYFIENGVSETELNYMVKELPSSLLSLVSK